MTFYPTNKSWTSPKKKWPETDVNGRLKSVIIFWSFTKCNLMSPHGVSLTCTRLLFNKEKTRASQWKVRPEAIAPNSLKFYHFMKLVENNEVFKWHLWKNYDSINLEGGIRIHSWLFIQQIKNWTSPKKNGLRPMWMVDWSQQSFCEPPRNVILWVPMKSPSHVQDFC